MDCRQLGREEDEANNKNLTNCEQWEADRMTEASAKGWDQLRPVDP